MRCRLDRGEGRQCYDIQAERRARDMASYIATKTQLSAETPLLAVSRTHLV